MPVRAAVRAAGPADFEALFALLLLMHAETPVAPLCLQAAREGVREVLETGAVLVSLAPDGSLAGTLGLAVDRPFFSAQRWFNDAWSFVHPAHRRQPHARALLRAAVALARHNRMPLRISVWGEGPRTAAKVRLFSRALGRAPAGATFIVRD